MSSQFFCSRSILFWIDPIMALWLWVLPHWIANAFVINSGMYVQHSDCVAKTPCGAGKALHRICVELFQSHDVQHRFSSGAPPRIPGSIGQNYRNFIHASSRSSFTRERMWFPLGTTMQPFYSRGTRIAENASTSRTRDTQAVDHCIALLMLS